MPELAAGATIHVPIALRWSDADQYGHVNNVTMLGLLEEARIRGLGLPDLPGATASAATAPLLSVLGGGTFTIVAAQRIEYLAELASRGQTLDAELWLSRIGSRSVTMDCRLRDGDVLHAIASVTIVVMDAATRRPRELDDAERDALGALSGPALAFR